MTPVKFDRWLEQYDLHGAVIVEGDTRTIRRVVSYLTAERPEASGFIGDRTTGRDAYPTVRPPVVADTSGVVVSVSASNFGEALAVWREAGSPVVEGIRPAMPLGSVSLPLPSTSRE